MINKNFKNLKQNYLFMRIAEKVKAFEKKNPNIELLKLGIGDVTQPLCNEVITAMHKAVDELSKAETFRGYCLEQGYLFLREKISSYYKKKFGVCISSDEIFINDGAKSDLGNILDLFEKSQICLIADPVYPAHLDANIISGHKILFMNACEENDFLPLPDESIKANLIYLCSPNNPTGAVYTRDQLQMWVNYANKNGSVIIFDAAYESFIEDKNLPHSIFEIPGSENCAIEICSFSKIAGFTGTRCGYTVISKKLIRDEMSIKSMWMRRQATKFNGVAYVVQRAAEAVFSDLGMQQIMKNIHYYKENTKILANLMKKMNLFYVGGENSPYIWFKCPKNMNSWDFFDLLLEKAHIIGTPGEGFGRNGKNFFRFSAFGNQKTVLKSAENFENFMISQ